MKSSLSLRSGLYGGTFTGPERFLQLCQLRERKEQEAKPEAGHHKWGHLMGSDCDGTSQGRGFGGKISASTEVPT